MHKKVTLFAVLSIVFVSSMADADIVLFEIETDPDAWADAVSGLVVSNHYDFDQDGDYGIEGFDGPLTSQGGNPNGNPGPVSPGILPDKMVIDSELNGPGGPGRGVGGTGLVAVTSIGLPGKSNAVLANFFVDAFGISLDEPKNAFEFNALTLLGSKTVDIIATDQDGDQHSFAEVPVNADFGVAIGLLGVNGTRIQHVSIYDRFDGAEGVAGAGRTYVIPEPGCGTTLGLLIAVALLRRKKLTI